MFRNGRWRSQWEIPALEKNETIEINGISRINVHYYEDGNVQLSTKKNLTAQAKYSSCPIETAKTVVSGIEKAEAIFEVCLFILEFLFIKNWKIINVILINLIGQFFTKFVVLECHHPKLHCYGR